MDDSWHFRPIPDHHQLCPVCSTPHYPFCTQSPPFPGDNFRFFPSDLRPSHFQRPFYNPPHPRPFSVPQANGSAPFQPSFQSSFAHDDASEREGFRKRMRMEDPAIRVFPPPEPCGRTISAEDERRLNLIRNHGMQGSTQAKDGYHWNNNCDYRMDRHAYDAERKLFSSPRTDHAFPEPDFDHHRNGYSHANAYDGYRNQQVSSLDRGDRFMLQEKKDFKLAEFKSDSRSMLDIQIGDCANAHDGYRNQQQVSSLDMGDRFMLQEKKDFKLAEFKSDSRAMLDIQIGDCYPYDPSAHLDRISQVSRFNRFEEAFGGSEDFLSNAPRRSFLNDSFRLTSYSTIDENPLRVENFHDQQKYHSAQCTSPLLTTDNYRFEPIHQDHTTQNQIERKSEFHSQIGDVRTPFYHHPIVSHEIHKPLDSHAYHAVEQLGLHISKHASYVPVTAEANHVMPTSIPEQGHTSQAYPSTPAQSLFQDANHLRSTSMLDHDHTSQAYPSIPPQPLFPIQTEQSLPSLKVTSSTSATISVASPVGANTSTKSQLSSQVSQSLPKGEFYNEPSVQASNGFAIERSSFIHQSSSKSKLEERGPSFPEKHSWKEEPVYVDATHLFKQPYRASRPDHIVIILRGFPGSGKSYLAKALRDIEVENGGSAPRIHAMDDYFMMEVEKKVEESDAFKSSGSVRSRKQITKKVIEYCYEPEMEEAYRSSMLKSFKKTLEDGIFTLVIVDDRNLRVADFAQFWAVAKRSGYEVYLLEATYKDPAGCAARNIHGFKLADIQEMAKQWEEAPSLYLHLDIQSLFGGDDLIGQSIQEVDMDADDTVGNEEAHIQEGTDGWNSTELNLLDQESDHGSTNLGKRWNTEEVEVILEKNDLQKSKWPEDLSVNLHDSNSAMASALSGLIQAYGKGAKFVHWGDKVEASGFSIGANNRQSASSLIIGPGAGYNLKSNPLPEENLVEEATRKISNDTKRRFTEQLRAERESFRAVFDRRRQRVGGLWDADDE